MTDTPEEAARPTAEEIAREIVARAEGKDLATFGWRKSEARYVEFVIDHAAVVARAYLALLAPSPAGGEGDAWRTMNNAPKGIKVLVGYYNDLGKWRTVTARYYEAGTLDCNDDTADEAGFAPEGWYEESETHDDLLSLPVPSRWMPLPAPPSAENVQAPERASKGTTESFTDADYLSRIIALEAMLQEQHAEIEALRDAINHAHACLRTFLPGTGTPDVAGALAHLDTVRSTGRGGKE